MKIETNSLINPTKEQDPVWYKDQVADMLNNWLHEHLNLQRYSDKQDFFNSRVDTLDIGFPDCQNPCHIDVIIAAYLLIFRTIGGMALRQLGQGKFFVKKSADWKQVWEVMRTIDPSTIKIVATSSNGVTAPTTPPLRKIDM